MPVGMWVRRTAESVLLMCWPPAPLSAEGVGAHIGRVDVDLDRVVDFRVDEHARRTLVWRPPEQSNGLLRTRRCTPVSVRRQAEGVLAFDLDGGALDAGGVAVGLVFQRWP